MRLLLCNEQCVTLVKTQFPAIDNLIKMILASPILDFTICTHLMFSKFQLDNQGGKAAKDDEDTGLDDVKVKQFFKKFSADAQNKQQLDVIMSVKTEKGI